MFTFLPGPFLVQFSGPFYLSTDMRETCLPDKYQNRSRFIYRSPNQDEVNGVRFRQNTADFKNKLKERQWKIEGLFAEAKENHCLRRAKYRGIHKF